MAEVVLDGVSKCYERGSYAVKRASLRISDGEFLVLVGPSGCGKSTLLRLIAGLETISEGDIFIGDRCVNQVAPKDRDIAMVFQNYALYPHMSVRQNLSFGLKLRGFGRSEIEKRVVEAAAMLGLGELLERLPKQLSGGQRQRVAVGRAIVRKPSVFLFDEPLSNLDAKMRLEMRVELKRLHQQIGATMIYVTHDQTEAMTLGDRVVVMDHGVLQQVAPPMEIYRKPHNLFVAGFIGSPPINTFRGRVAERGGELWFEGEDVSWKLDRSLWSAGSGGDEVVAGIRAEGVEFGSGGAEGGNLSATVEALEPMGSETVVYLRSSGGEPLVARAGLECELSLGSEVNLRLQLDQIHYFAGPGRERIRLREGEM